MSDGSKFFAWYDSREAAAIASPIGAALAPLGFTVHHTGGGCLAWRNEMGAAYALICDEGNGLGDTLDEMFLVGLYSTKTGDEIAGSEAPNLAGAIEKYNSMAAAFAISSKWVARLGGGFHPDTRGKDYAPALSPAEIAEYDSDIDTLFGSIGDPYAYAVAAIESK